MADEPKPSGLLPFVRHILICEHAEPAHHNPRRANIYGLFANVLVRGASARFPCGFGFTIYVMLSECRGDGIGRIVVSEAESGDVIYSGIPYNILLNDDPLQIHGVIFRIVECMLPGPGLYLVEFEFDGAVLCEESVLVAVR